MSYCKVLGVWQEVTSTANGRHTLKSSGITVSDRFALVDAPTDDAPIAPLLSDARKAQIQAVLAARS